MCPTGQDFGIGRQEPQPKDSGASVYSVEINHKRDRRFESGCFSDVKSTACFFGPEAIDGFSETERDDHFATMSTLTDRIRASLSARIQLRALATAATSPDAQRASDEIPIAREAPLKRLATAVAPGRDWRADEWLPRRTASGSPSKPTSKPYDVDPRRGTHIRSLRTAHRHVRLRGESGFPSCCWFGSCP